MRRSDGAQPDHGQKGRQQRRQGTGNPEVDESREIGGRQRFVTGPSQVEGGQEEVTTTSKPQAGNLPTHNL